jgi:hypothetical protein
MLFTCRESVPDTVEVLKGYIDSGPEEELVLVLSSGL